MGKVLITLVIMISDELVDVSILEYIPPSRRSFPNGPDPEIFGSFSKKEAADWTFSSSLGREFVNFLQKTGTLAIEKLAEKIRKENLIPIQVVDLSSPDPAV